MKNQKKKKTTNSTVMMMDLDVHHRGNEAMSEMMCAKEIIKRPLMAEIQHRHFGTRQPMD